MMRCNEGGLCRHAELSYDGENIEGCRIESEMCERIVARMEEAEAAYRRASDELDAALAALTDPHPLSTAMHLAAWDRYNVAQRLYTAAMHEWADELERLREIERGRMDECGGLEEWDPDLIHHLRREAEAREDVDR